MQINKLISLVGLSTILLLAPFTATYAGLYLGGSWGAFKVNEGDLDDNDDMLKAFVGVGVNSTFSIEGQWTDFNRLSNRNGDRFDGDGMGLSAVISFPLGGGSALFAKGGNFWWDSDSSFAGSRRDPDGSDPFLGFGYRSGVLRLEWERYDISGVDLDTVSIGLQFGF
jgi:OmpA-OmpF porin, OOP family